MFEKLYLPITYAHNLENCLFLENQSKSISFVDQGEKQ